MELLNILIFTMLANRQPEQKKPVNNFKKRKQEIQRKRELQFDYYAKLVYEINEVTEYRHGKPLFDSNLKIYRKFFGNKLADNFLERIDRVNETEKEIEISDII